MRDRMERLVILPFSVGCISEASVAVGAPQPRKSRSDTNSPAAAATRCTGEEEGESLSLYGENTKSNVSGGLNRLLKGFKNLSQIFGEKEDEEAEEEEREMEIGGPTDVQHVTHIGLDGHAITANPAVTMSMLSLSLHHYHAHSLP